MIGDTRIWSPPAERSDDFFGLCPSTCGKAELFRTSGGEAVRKFGLSKGLSILTVLRTKTGIE
jgi:hypothetical protein